MGQSMVEHDNRTARRTLAAPRVFDGAGLRWSPFPVLREGSTVRHAFPAREAVAFVDALPSVAGKSALRRAVQAMIAASSERRAVIWAIDAGVLRAGMAPLVLDFVERGLITCLCLDGDAARFDVEQAMFGQGLSPWQEHAAGFWEETGALWAEAVHRGRARRLGVGRALGCTLTARQIRFQSESVLAACAEADVPVTVHCAPGSLGVEMHPDFSGADFGEAAMIDFRAAMQAGLGLNNGAWVHAASSPQLGGLLCRALAIMQNLDMPPDQLTCALAGPETCQAVSEELRHALASDRFPGRRVVRLPGAYEFVLPILRGMVLRESGLADVYRDL